MFCTEKNSINLKKNDFVDERFVIYFVAFNMSVWQSDDVMKKLYLRVLEK